MKKVLILASLAESLSNFRGSLISSFVEKGYEVHVASPALTTTPKVSNSLRQREAICHDVYLSRTGISPINDLRTLLSIYRLIKQVRPNIFLGYTIKPVIWGLKAASLAGVEKRVALITGLGYAFTGKAAGFRGFVQKLAKLLYKSSLKRASLVFFQNVDDLEEFSAKGILPKKIPTEVVNGSGVDVVNFENASFPSIPNISYLLIARLLGDKGIREYAEAAREISIKFPQVEFHIVGGLDTNPNGIPEGDINSWVQEGIIKWHGVVDDVRPFIANSNVYVLPSYREGTPRSVLEAMSMGRPIITTDAPGCRETVIEGQNGFLVDVKSVDQLVVAMERFIKQPELIKSMGKRSREIACEKYDVHKVNDVMLKAMGVIKESGV